MSPIRTFAAVLAAALLSAGAASAQRSNPCDPRYHFITPANCTTAAEQAGKHLVEMRQAIGDWSAMIAKARRRFWETYPDKPGAAAAKDAFGQALHDKDVYYLWLALTEALGGLSAKSIEMLGGKVDGGIPAYSRSEFIDWVEDIKFNLGERPITHDNLTEARMKELKTLPERLVKAMAASEKKHDVYTFERDWGEFDAVGREPAGLDDPAVYFGALCVRAQKIGWDDALVEYEGIVHAMGKDNVLRAIEQVHAAPRVRFGVLKVTAPEPVMTTPSGQKVPDPSIPGQPGVIGVTASGIRAVERLAIQNDDRRYLLWILTSENRPGWGSHIEQSNKWQYAEATYHRFALAFGEPALLQAAHLVGTSVKRATSGGVMDPAAIGATRSDPFPAFADIVTRQDPRGYVRSVLAVAQKLNTVGEVDAAYATFVAQNNERTVLDGARAAAEAGKSQPHYEREMDRIIGPAAAALAADKPAEARMDYPEYLAWKGFRPGAKVTYAMRVWQPEKYNSDHFLPGPVSYRHSYLLRAVTDAQAQLWFTEIMFDSRGQARPPRETEIGYPSKVVQARYATTVATAPEPGRRGMDAAPATAPLESGEETIAINGRPTSVRWQARKYTYNGTSRDKECDLIVKVWTSDAVPSGLVRKTEDKWCPETTHAGSHVIDETFLESFEEHNPGTPGAAVPPPAMATFVPPAGRPVRGGFASEAASRSAPGAKPTGAASVKGAAVGGTVVGGASASGTSAAGASAAGA
ncbi:MAG: hypothetical protein ACHQQ3_07340, partial [Gemmatimonadales bacterium]